MIRSSIAQRSLVGLIIGFAGIAPSASGQPSTGLAPSASGQAPASESGWVLKQDDARGITVRTMTMTLHPRGEPRPAMKHRFLPSEFDLLDGNAATFYLSAMGFLEQSAAHQRWMQFMSDAGEQGRQEGKDRREMPPYSWEVMTPDQLPLEEVRDYLQLLSFQPRYMEEAVRRRHFDLDRNLRQQEDLVGFLLPEIQVTRELARNQSLRCKLAIAEGRIDDALAILGQQFALARHLGQDVFLVSGVVGNAVAGLASDDAFQLAQHSDAPNLYWAYASLPRPLVDPRLAFAVEHDLFYLQLKPLREVDERPQPAGYWRAFVDRLIPTLRGLDSEFGLPPLPEDLDEARSVMTAMIAGVYPAAKRYLLEEAEFSAEQVEAYPTTQTVLLALVHVSDAIRDENFKWTHIPSWQARTYRASSAAATQRWADAERLGWLAVMAGAINVRVSDVMNYYDRIEQSLALLQTVEAIRMYAAVNGGRLPKALSELPVPAAVDPVSGKPFEYQLDGDRASLIGQPLQRHQYQLQLRVVSSDP